MACTDGKGMEFRPLTNEATSDHEGTPLIQPRRKSPIGKPETAESVAESILADLCESQSVRDSIAESTKIDELVRRLAGISINHSPCVKEKRTLYSLPQDAQQDPRNGRCMKTRGLKLVRRKLDSLHGKRAEEMEKISDFHLSLNCRTKRVG